MPSKPQSGHHRVLDRGAVGYPAAFERALGDAAPPTVWARGHLAEGLAVAIVGARSASAPFLSLARALAARLESQGRIIVSGGALGIDGAAHRGALDAGARTIVVLGTGIDVPYPRQHAGLFDEIEARGGGILSPFRPGTGPLRWGFPKRNQLVAALAQSVVVVEAGEGSGSLHTAEAARRLGRRVIVLAGSAGCELLASRGAELARSLDEVLALCLAETAPPSAMVPFLSRQVSLALGDPTAPSMPATRAAPATLPDDPRARQLYEALDATPRDLGEVAARAGLPPSDVMALAIDLELGGLAARAAGGRYLRLG